MASPAIADRELRAQARQWATHRNRLAAGGVAVAIVLVMLLAGELFSAWQTVGRALFRTLSWLAFLFCLFEGLRNTADCLSVEKREGTLGLLFLTDLTGLDIILGKLAAHSLGCFYNLMAAFPALAIPFILGGVTAGEFWRTVLALLVVLFFSLCSGLLISAWGRNERAVWAMGLLVVLVFAGILPLLDFLLAAGDVSQFVPRFSLLSPGYAFFAATDAMMQSVAAPFWSCLGMVHLLSWLFLMLAGFVVLRTWRDTDERAGEPWAWLRWLARPWRLSGKSSTRAQQRLQANPAWWLMDKNRQLDGLLWIALLLAIILVIAARLLIGLSDQLFWVYVGIFYLAHWFLRLWIAAVACYSIASARDSGVLELTLVTPLPTDTMVRGCFKAVETLFLKPLLVLGFVETITLAEWAMFSTSSNIPPLVVFVCLGMAFALLVLDLYAVTYAGLWQGLTQRKPLTATTRTILRVLLLPWLLVVIVPIFLLFCGPGIFIGFLLKDVVFISGSKLRLQSNFRKVLIQPAEYEQERWWNGWPFKRAARASVLSPPPIPPPLPPQTPLGV
ncbi:MAG: hypothetical protein WCO56_22945 [Verrucomicrobiota bacterium]